MYQEQLWLNASPSPNAFMIYHNTAADCLRQPLVDTLPTQCQAAQAGVRRVQARSDRHAQTIPRQTNR